MNNINPIILLPLLCGSIFTIFSIVFLKFPPKHKNPYFGYRTKKAKANSESWDFAQRFSSKSMLFSGVALAMSSLLGLIIKTTEEIGVIVGLILVLTALAFILISTERALKNKFGK